MTVRRAADRARPRGRRAARPSARCRRRRHVDVGGDAAPAEEPVRGVEAAHAGAELAADVLPVERGDLAVEQLLRAARAVLRDGERDRRPDREAALLEHDARRCRRTRARRNRAGSRHPSTRLRSSSPATAGASACAVDRRPAGGSCTPQWSEGTGDLLPGDLPAVGAGELLERGDEHDLAGAQSQRIVDAVHLREGPPRARVAVLAVGDGRRGESPSRTVCALRGWRPPEVGFCFSARWRAPRAPRCRPRAAASRRARTACTSPRRS